MSHGMYHGLQTHFCHLCHADFLDINIMASKVSSLFRVMIPLSSFVLFFLLVNTMQWMSVICLSISHSFRNSLLSAACTWEWASIPWSGLLYLSKGPTVHWERGSKSRFGEWTWLPERERVILCHLGFLGIGDPFYIHMDNLRSRTTEKKHEMERDGRKWEELRQHGRDVLLDLDPDTP